MLLLLLNEKFFCCLSYCLFYIQIFSNIVPVVICAGESHNMIVSKKGGEVYSFGSGNYGKLGIATRNDLKDHRTNIDSANPANVRDIDGEPLELGELPDFAIKQGKLDIRSVSCYSNHSLALS